MADRPHLQLRDLPWEPLDSEPVLVLAEYNGPRLGVFRQHGVLYLYQALFDAPSGSGLWTYSLISDSDLRRLQDAPSDEIDEIVDEVSLDAPSELAILTKGRIFGSVATRGVKIDDIEAGLTQLLGELTEMLHSVRLGRVALVG